MKIVSQIVEALKHFKAATEKKDETKLQQLAPQRPTPGRAPYSFNIGLDFGTAFSKCVLRDTRQEPSRATLVKFRHNGENPYLVPSEVYFEDNVLFTPLDLDARVPVQSIGHLKMALYATVRGHRSDPWLLGVAQHWPEDSEEELDRKVETLVVLYLAALIRHSLATLKAQLPDFGEVKGDLCAVNMAVPVAHAQDAAVEEAFRDCLNRAWRLAQCSADGQLPISECIKKVGELRPSESEQFFCSIYPEVSANVQAFIQSRAGFEGLFLFVDVGAGTVDASVFIYWPHPGNEKPLSYFAADVIPLGSSQIEIRAAAAVTRVLQDQFRWCKEELPHQSKLTIDLSEKLEETEKALEAELVEKVGRTAGIARGKIVAPDRAGVHQWRRLRILMGGGGSAAPMYSAAARGSFATWNFTPGLSSLPIPTDLEWPTEISDKASLFRRVSVAYGLSFDRTTLQDHRYPDEVSPLPEQVRAERERYSAPSKDEV